MESTNDAPEPQRPIVQLRLDGFVDPSDGVDPRFILSDETCRIGRKYLAEMRRILREGRAA
ncbi:MAG: hypothetical protein ACKOHN_00070 [Actinomycetota bacterium]